MVMRLNDLSEMMTVYIIKERGESNIQASRKEQAMRQLHSLHFQSHKRKKAAVFWIGIQRQFENINWTMTSSIDTRAQSSLTETKYKQAGRLKSHLKWVRHVLSSSSWWNWLSRGLYQGGSTPAQAQQRRGELHEFFLHFFLSSLPVCKGNQVIRKKV